MLVFDINVYLLSKVWGELFDLAVIQNESSELTQFCDAIVHAGRRRGRGRGKGRMGRREGEIKGKERRREIKGKEKEDE